MVHFARHESAQSLLSELKHYKMHIQQRKYHFYVMIITCLVTCRGLK